MMQRVSSASLGVFRVLFGLLTIAYCTKRLYLQHWLLPGFRYHWFWLQHIPEPYPVVLPTLIIGAALCVGMGVGSRFFSFLLGCSFVYYVLLDQRFNTPLHLLIILIAFLMSVIRADWGCWAHIKKGIPPSEIALWQVSVFQIQFGLVFVFLAVSKLTDASWLSSVAVSQLAGKLDHYSILKEWLLTPASAFIFSVLGPFLEIGAPALLFFKKTRLTAFWFFTGYYGIVFLTLVSAKTVHQSVETWTFFWMFLVAGMTLFFSPDWPIKALDKLRELGRTFHCKGRVQTQKHIGKEWLWIMGVLFILQFSFWSLEMSGILPPVFSWSVNPLHEIKGGLSFSVVSKMTGQSRHYRLSEVARKLSNFTQDPYLVWLAAQKIQERALADPQMGPVTISVRWYGGNPLDVPYLYINSETDISKMTYEEFKSAVENSKGKYLLPPIRSRVAIPDSLREAQFRIAPNPTYNMVAPVLGEDPMKDE